jgi:hypothetical protein
MFLLSVHLYFVKQPVSFNIYYEEQSEPFSFLFAKIAKHPDKEKEEKRDVELDTKLK